MCHLLSLFLKFHKAIISLNHNSLRSFLEKNYFLSENPTLSYYTLSYLFSYKIKFTTRLEKIFEWVIKNLLSFFFQIFTAILISSKIKIFIPTLLFLFIVVLDYFQNYNLISNLRVGIRSLLGKKLSLTTAHSRWGPTTKYPKVLGYYTRGSMTHRGHESWCTSETQISRFIESKPP